ncbi:hypothetical protein E2542_SST00783 [Spatholobus suberectus]|nr:hypothetical protein E2542_SST00783 [Spatholobus suberectus]
MKNSFFWIFALQQKKVDEDVIKLAKDQKIQKEQLYATIIQLQTQLHIKQELELDIQQLKGSLNVLKHLEHDEDAEVLKKTHPCHHDTMNGPIMHSGNPTLTSHTCELSSPQPQLEITIPPTKTKNQ